MWEAKDRHKSLAKVLAEDRNDLRIPPSQTLVLVLQRNDFTELMSEPVGIFSCVPGQIAMSAPNSFSICLCLFGGSWYFGHCAHY